MTDRISEIEERFWDASHGPDEYIGTSECGAAHAIDPDSADAYLDEMCQAFADLADLVRRQQEVVGRVRKAQEGIGQAFDEWDKELGLLARGDCDYSIFERVEPHLDRLRRALDTLEDEDD